MKVRLFMTTETMTVHEALCEVKVADKKINKLLFNTIFVTASKASNTKIEGISIEEFKDGVSSKYQKITDYINRVDAIKKALNKSNAETIIKVGDKNMSVAEAIYQLQHGVVVKEDLITTLKHQYSNALDTIEAENGDKMNKRVDKLIADTYGNNKDKIDPDAIDTTTKNFLKQNEFVLIDAIGIKKEIEKLEDELDSFLVNVDSALQISNATTSITIEY